MKEIEVKFEVKNFKDKKIRLQKLGAELIWKGKEKNFYFDARDGKLKKSGAVLRLREWGGLSNTLTLKIDTKNKNKKYKIRKELQIEIDNIAEASKIFSALGFSGIFRYSKYREHWKLKDASIELDRLENGRCFVEIESTQKRINELAKILKLDWEKSTTNSYLTILSSPK